MFLAIASMANNCKTGECQKNSRQSDSFIVPKKLGNANGEGLHNNGLSEDTSTVLRDGGIDGNKLERIAEISASSPRPEFTSFVSSNQ